LQYVCVGLIRTGEAQPDLFGIEDEDENIFELEFLGIPVDLIVVVSVLPTKAGLTVISGVLQVSIF